MPPKKNRTKREQAATTDLQRVFRQTLPTCAWEVKVAQKRKGGDRLCASQVEPHQWNALRMASEGGICYKIPDEGIGAKPFDGFVLRGVPAYLCCVFGKNFYLAPWRLVFEWFRAERSIGEAEFASLSKYKGSL